VTREIEVQRQLLAERLEVERRRGYELDIAKQVQARLFPQALLSMETLELAGMCIQARQVGGDYFDFLELGEARFALITADVAGKGMAAALLMANLQANLRIHCENGSTDPSELLRSVNQVFHKNSPESAFATLFYAEYDDRQRRLRYVNCGHLPALLLRSDNTGAARVNRSGDRAVPRMGLRERGTNAEYWGHVGYLYRRSDRSIQRGGGRIRRRPIRRLIETAPAFTPARYSIGTAR